MYCFFAVLYIIDLFVLSYVGQRQVTTRNGGGNTDTHTGSGDNINDGKQSVNFGKRRVTKYFTRASYNDNNNNKNVNGNTSSNTNTNNSSGANINNGNQNVKFGKRQETNDFTRASYNDNNSNNNNVGGNTNVNTNNSGGANTNNGNQNVNFGKRQVRNVFTRASYNNNNNVGGNTHTNTNTSSGANNNSGNQNVNFGKWKFFFPSVASWAWKTAAFCCGWVMFSPVDLTFLASQEGRSYNCKSWEKIKVFKIQLIFCMVNCVILYCKQ